MNENYSLPCVKGGGPTNVGGGIVRLAQTHINTKFFQVLTIPQSASLTGQIVKQVQHPKIPQKEISN